MLHWDTLSDPENFTIDGKYTLCTWRHSGYLEDKFYNNVDFEKM